jgi:FkbM family methyltransferase
VTNSAAMEQPLVSIGVPTFNRPQLLAHALDCLANQTYRNLEIIISDNASTDPRVATVIADYSARDSRVRSFRQSENIGAPNNFLFVLEKSAGQYFMWAADDDEWTPDFIEFGLAQIGDAGTVMGDIDTVYHTRGEIIRSLVPNLDPRRSVSSNAKAFLRNMQSSILYGLHKTDLIRSCMTTDTFDFLDCFLVYKMIIRYGVKTISGARYRAGVATPAYEIKACDQVTGRLHYFPFASATIRETWASGKLSLSEKISLSFQIFYVTFSLYHHHNPRKLGFIYRAFEIFTRSLKLLKRVISGISQTFKDFSPRKSARASYSQAGEDMIVDFIFKALRVSKPSYLDIGAHHPFQLSNTYYFYLNGCRGVTVEPDPNLFGLLVQRRPNETHLNVGVGAETSDKLPFHVMSTPTLNTFSNDEAIRYEKTGLHKIVRVEKIPVITISEIFDKYFSRNPPDFLSIDVEGLDFEIIKSINFAIYRPCVICIETLTFSENREEKKLIDITAHMESQGYMIYADTYINTIFVDLARWKSR